LTGSHFNDAVQVLEACEAEGIANSEVFNLLEFARNEEKESTTQNLKRNRLISAHYLVNQGEYEQAIGFLNGVLAEGEEPALRALLDEATSARDAAQRQAEAALASAGRLSQAGKTGDALQLLRVLPRDVVRIKPVQIAIAALEDEQMKALFRMTGRAYAMLGSDLPGGHRIMQRVGAGSADASAAAALAASFHTRERENADRKVNDAVQRSETLVRSRDFLAAEILVHETDLIAQMASPERRNAWAEHTGRLSRKGLKTRV